MVECCNEETKKKGGKEGLRLLSPAAFSMPALVQRPCGVIECPVCEALESALGAILPCHYIFCVLVF